MSSLAVCRVAETAWFTITTAYLCWLSAAPRSAVDPSRVLPHLITIGLGLVILHQHERDRLE